MVKKNELKLDLFVTILGGVQKDLDTERLLGKDIERISEMELARNNALRMVCKTLKEHIKEFGEPEDKKGTWKDVV